MLFLSITIAIRFSSRFFISINNLISASIEIGKGNLNTKVPELKADIEMELLNKNFNGKIIFDIHSLLGIKLFDKAKINLEILNGKLMLNNSTMISKKIGKVTFLDSVIQEKDDKKIIKAKLLFDVIDQKKFYQKLQVPKSNRKNLNNIYLEIERDFEVDDFKINKFIINKKLKNNLEDKTKDLTNLLNINEINNVKNWIELKKLLNQIFSEIN